MQIEIYTDGACRGNPGPGGWGVLIKRGTDTESFSGAEGYTTNNKMELLAAIKGLSLLSEPSELTVYTDSKYVCNGITEWLPNWKRKNWRTASGSPVKNVELWQALDEEVKRHKVVKWQWVKGHSGHTENDFVDELANKAIDEML